MNYVVANQLLCQACLDHSISLEYSPTIKNEIGLALKKTLSSDRPYPLPPLLVTLLAEDLGAEYLPIGNALALICAYFYTAADLLDDIQDQDLSHPLLQVNTPEQALNITNILMMEAFHACFKLPITAENCVALTHTFSKMVAQMSQGQYWDLASSNCIQPDVSPIEIAKAKAGLEFGAFLASLPTALGKNAQDFFELGETLGILLQISTDYLDIWLVKDSRELSPDLLALKNSYPLYWARQGEHQKIIERFFAGHQHWPAKQFQLRRLLSQTQAIEKLAELNAELEQGFEKSFQKLPELPHIQTFVFASLKQSQDIVASLFKLRDITKNESYPFLEVHQKSKSMRMACDYLEFIPDFQDAWEVQRWGFLEQSPLYGDIFNPLLILEALATYGQDIQTPLRRILQKSAEDGWHYYSNTLSLPTDSDDLGQALHLAHHLPQNETAPLFKTPLEILMKSLDHTGRCPTWLASGSHTTENIAKTWYGNECAAVMANVYYGLHRFEPVLYRPYIERGIKYLIGKYQTANSAWESSYYGSRAYTRYLIARLLSETQYDFNWSESIEHCLDTQSLNGSWQKSPQETAFNLLFLSLPLGQNSSRLQSALKRGESFLLESQQFDGSWLAENLFIRPGKHDTLEYFSHPKLTSAFCLRALTHVNA